MSLNILDHLTLSYQPVWGRDRELAAVRLRVRPLHPEVLDAAHFLQVLEAEHVPGAPLMLVAFEDRRLLGQALSLSPHDNIWLELPDDGEFATEALRQQVLVARRMGHTLLQASPLARALVVPGNTRPSCVLSLWPEQVAQALQAAAARAQGQKNAPTPVLPGQVYQHIGSRALAEHCLDDARAWGLCGWPVDDVLHGHRKDPITCDPVTIRQVQKALDADRPLEVIEELLNGDPVLAYRLLRMVNSVAFGGNREVSNLRHAVMLLGQSNVRQWLYEQSRAADTDAAMRPVRQTQVLRARLTEYLMDPGPENDLRAEIYTTGLFAELDGLLQEPLAEALERLPLSGRMLDALLRQTGPYHPFLQMARHLENAAAMAETAALCEVAEFRLDDVNRALIRMLNHVTPGTR